MLADNSTLVRSRRLSPCASQFGPDARLCKKLTIILPKEAGFLLILLPYWANGRYIWWTAVLTCSSADTGVVPTFHRTSTTYRLLTDATLSQASRRPATRYQPAAPTSQLPLHQDCPHLCSIPAQITPTLPRLYMGVRS